jgi:PilZ domain-containing protein
MAGIHENINQYSLLRFFSVPIIMVVQESIRSSAQTKQVTYSMATDDKRQIERTICNRQVSFSIDGDDYEGTIENISNVGTLILTNTPMQIQQGNEISITITTADQGELKKARVVWADDGAFGAEFL